RARPRGPLDEREQTAHQVAHVEDGSPVLASTDADRKPQGHEFRARDEHGPQHPLARRRAVVVVTHARTAHERKPEHAYLAVVTAHGELVHGGLREDLGVGVETSARRPPVQRILRPLATDRWRSW